ncbi:MAG: hypothetical protein HLUCCA11_24290 [Phormidesmis priestleyi Ana]|uniref:Uncharacterized protein n=1 Tax=Phormidesmis priestleyi Ana TaxID=1666911 RepID=A0A0P7ZF95_9CYAN|nr:MAG: hypothetical protein HLUCCA11_24290 [Phormidesmis priestleyi Ana]
MRLLLVNGINIYEFFQKDNLYQFSVCFLPYCLSIWRLKKPINLASKIADGLSIWRLKKPINLASKIASGLSIWRLKKLINLLYSFIVVFLEKD